MKLRVLITPKPGVLDPEGRAVHRALGELGYASVSDVRIGKIVELELDMDDVAAARAAVADMCEKLLASPVIETYEILD
jgi:phosphoribosylformylglycinamidine synthase